MGVSQDTVRQLAALYERRLRVARAGNDASQNFWIGVLNDAFGGTGTRSSLVETLGGRGEMAVLLKAAVDARLTQISDEIDSEIVSLGGDP